MYTFAVSVALACLLQVAHSNPDFGIQGTVPGTSNVIKWAIVAKGHFLRVDDYIMPDQKSDLSKLADSADILSKIGQMVNTLGPALMDTITTVTDDDSGDIQTTYAKISYARLMFDDYINTMLVVQIQSIEALQGVYIRDQLVDDFFHIQQRLDKLRDTLDTLQEAVTLAQEAAGGGPVSNALVAQFIDDALVEKLGRHLALLAHRIPVLMYTLTSSLENIQQADDYIFGLLQDASRVLEEVDATKTAFFTDASAYSVEVEAAMNTLIGDYEVGLGNAVTTAGQLAVTSLSTGVGGLAGVRATTLAARLESYKTLYGLRVLELSQLLPLESNFFFGEDENPADVLINVLTANGPWARFCFWKYASALHNLLLVSNFASECYDRELDRLRTLQQALLIEIELFAYDLEIVDPYSTACTFLPDSATGRKAECAGALGGYFLSMFGVYGGKLDAFVSLAEIELRAAKQRLSVCWATRMEESYLRFQTIVPEIIACGHSGPLA